MIGVFYIVVVINKFPPVFRGMASYFPRFSSSSPQNVVTTPQESATYLAFSFVFANYNFFHRRVHH